MFYIILKNNRRRKQNRSLDGAGRRLFVRTGHTKSFFPEEEG